MWTASRRMAARGHSAAQMPQPLQCSRSMRYRVCGAPAAAATVAGDTVAVWSGSSNAPQIKAGRLRPLAVSGAKRSEQYPDLPTIGEFYPGFENSIWLGLFGPAGIPENALSRIRTEVRRVLESDDVKLVMGFFAGGEIGHHHLYGYTGVLTVFTRAS